MARRRFTGKPPYLLSRGEAIDPDSDPDPDPDETLKPRNLETQKPKRVEGSTALFRFTVGTPPRSVRGRFREPSPAHASRQA